MGEELMTMFTYSAPGSFVAQVDPDACIIEVRPTNAGLVVYSIITVWTLLLIILTAALSMDPTMVQCTLNTGNFHYYIWTMWNFTSHLLLFYTVVMHLIIDREHHLHPDKGLRHTTHAYSAEPRDNLTPRWFQYTVKHDQHGKTFRVKSWFTTNGHLFDSSDNDVTLEYDPCIGPDEDGSEAVAHSYAAMAKVSDYIVEQCAKAWETGSSSTRAVPSLSSETASICRTFKRLNPSGCKESREIATSTWQLTFTSLLLITPARSEPS
eukprot:728300-Rhodomonas_salina.1